MGNIAIADPSRHLAGIDIKYHVFALDKSWIYLHLLRKRTIDCNGGSHSTIWLFGRRIWKVSGLICISEAVKGKMKARE